MIPLETADQISEAIVLRLRPFAARIEVAGSIRRRRPQVNDIDLVAIPQLREVRSSMFEVGTEEPKNSQLVVALCALAGAVECRGNSIVRLEIPRTRLLDPSTFQLSSLPTSVEEVGVDLYLATPETWATTLPIRTGSAAHNIWLCQRARQFGGRLHANGEGLELAGEYDPVAQRCGPGRRVAPATEAEIFDALGVQKLYRTAIGQPGTHSEIEGIPPHDRECDASSRPAWLPKEAA